MLQTIKENREDFIKVMEEMTAIKSLPGEEGEVAEYLLKKLQKMQPDEAFIDGIGNVVAVVRGNGTGPNILLNGHMDIVPEGSLENWGAYDPYVPVIEDGKMIGRGTSDMKCGLAAQLFAMEAMVKAASESGRKLPGDLIFCAVVQEEPAEMFGMEYFFDHTMKEKNLVCYVALIAEPSDGDLAIGQRGKMELVVKTYGKCAHSSVPKEGVDALEFMLPILQDIYTHTGIDLEPDPYLGETVIAVTNVIVKPGGNLSTIPDECEICVDRRYATNQTDEELLGEFEAIFKRLKTRYPEFKATVEPRVYEETSWTGYTKRVRKWHPAWRVPRDHPFVEQAFRALEKVGQTPKETYKQAGTDGSMTCCIHKIPTIIYSGAPAGQAHQPKEYVEIEEMVKTYEGYLAILTEMYGISLSEFEK